MAELGFNSVDWFESTYEFGYYSFVFIVLMKIVCKFSNFY